MTILTRSFNYTRSSLKDISQATNQTFISLCCPKNFWVTFISPEKFPKGPNNMDLFRTSNFIGKNKNPKNQKNYNIIAKYYITFELKKFVILNFNTIKKSQVSHWYLYCSFRKKNIRVLKLLNKD